MQLKNDPESRNLLDDTICEYYAKNGNRIAYRFLHSKDPGWGWAYSHFLVGRTHIIRYGVGEDRNQWVGGVELAIGPHYFGPGEFWSSENFWRFTNEATTGGVQKNLALLDEFWGLK